MRVDGVGNSLGHCSGRASPGSRLLGHTEEETTKKIRIRRGAVAKPAK